MRRGRRRLGAAVGLATLAFLALVVGAGPVLAQAGNADMRVTALNLGGSVPAGGTTSLRVEFRNAGPANAPGARLNVTFNQPVTVSGISADSGANCSGGATLRCTFGSPLPDGTRVNVQATVRVGAGASGRLTATAVANSNANDPDGGNNQRQATVDINASADLALSQSVSPNPPQARGNVTVRPVVTNKGPSDAKNVVVTVNVPAGVTLLAAGPSCTAAGAKLTCNLGTVAAGASEAVQVTYGLDRLLAGSQFVAAASVKSSTRDPNGGNNSVSQAYTVAAATADLSVSKTATPNPVGIGGSVTFAVTVRNAGPSDARNVVVTDHLPVGLRVRSSQAPGSCSPVGQTVICNVGTLAAGTAAGVTITADVLSGTRPGTIVNVVSVSSSTAESNPGNNSASASVRVVSTTSTTRRPPTTRPPTVRPTAEGPTTTLGDLPPTGKSGSPFGVAAMLVAFGVALWAASYRLRGVPDRDTD